MPERIFSAEEGVIPDVRRQAIVGGILMTMLIAAMDTMITTTIMPSVVSSLGRLSLYPWLMGGFLMASISAAPCFGRLADICGPRTISLYAIAIFASGSILCGFADSMEMLILGRVVQGIGSAGIMAMSYMLFGLLFHSTVRGKMYSLLNSVWAFASIAGPIVGAYFVEFLSWRWAFFINIPIAILAAVLLSLLPHSIKEKSEHDRMDTVGFILFSVGIVSIMYALGQISRLNFTLYPWLNLIGGGVLMTLFVTRTMSSKTPLIPLKLFRQKPMIVSMLLSCFGAATIFSTNNLLSLYIQGVLFDSAATTGWVLAPVSIGWLAGATLCGAALNKHGFQRITLVASLLLTTGFAMLSFITFANGIGYIICASFTLGAGIGILINSNLLVVHASCKPSEIGAATSGCNVFRSLGGTIGLTLAAGTQVGLFHFALSQVTPESVGYCPTFNALVESPQHLLSEVSRGTYSPECLSSGAAALGASIQQIFRFGTLFSMTAVLLAWNMPRENPEQLEAMQRNDQGEPDES